MKFRPFSNPSLSLNKNQVGAVSIYVSFVIMTVLTLIALTFAKIMSDHYVEIAESQYDLQAHYAAESAISSVRSTIHKGLRDREQVSGAAVEVTVDATNATNVNVAAICNGLSGYGASLDIAGDLLAVGATNGICLLTKTSDAEDWSGSLTLTKEEPVVPNDTGITPGSGANLGASVALNPSGNLLAVGAPGDRVSRGSVYIFKKQADASWSFINKIAPYTASGSDEDLATDVHDLRLSGVSTFGTALVWHGDKLLVGAPGNQTVYLLQKNNAGWQSMGVVNKSAPGFGSSLVKASIRFQESDDGVANFTIGSQDMIYLTRIVGDSFETTETLCSSCFSFTNLLAFYIDGGKLVTRDGSKVEVWERQGSSQWDKKYEIGNFSSPTEEEIHVDGIGGEFGRAFIIKDELLVIGDPSADKIHFLTIKDNNILKDIWAAGLDQDCPAQEDAHESWRNNTFGEVANISYTCVSVEVDPTDLIYDHVGIDRSLVLPLEPTEGKSYDDKQMESLSFYWNHVEGVSDFRPPGATDFPPTSSWTSPTAPLLRVQITPVNHSLAFSRESLVNNTRVFFLYPSATGGGPQNPTDWPDQDADGEIIDGYCDPQRKVVVDGNNEVIQPCGVTIKMPAFGDIETADPNVLSTIDDKLIYFVRIQSIYQPAQLNIRGKLIGGDDAHFKNIQAVITATGWSNNVAERIRERIPLRPVYDLPEYGIDSAETLCKILVTTESEGVYLDNEREDLHGEISCSLKVED